MKIKKVLYRNGVFLAWSEGDIQTQWGIVKGEDIEKAETIVKGHTGKEFRVFPANFNDNFDCFKKDAQSMVKKDIAYIMINSSLGKESTVLEAGTGSGFLTAYLARYVKKVTTYDLEQSRTNLAKKNTEGAELNNIEFKEGNIYDGIEEKELDAVILDLPEPFRVVEHAFKALKQGGYLTIYVPQMTQIIDFVKEAEKLFFVEKVIELNERNWNVSGNIARPRSPDVTHTAFLVFARKI